MCLGWGGGGGGGRGGIVNGTDWQRTVDIVKRINAYLPEGSDYRCVCVGLCGYG